MNQIYNFEWDPQKAKINQTKHNVTFERATEIFRDPLAISIYDEDHSTEEDRWITIGKDSNGSTIVVIHTFKEKTKLETNIRIISARKATKNEIKQYKGEL